MMTTEVNAARQPGRRARRRPSCRLEKEQPFLSVVLPAYNEQARIAGSLARLARYLGEQQYSWEVIVVDDGSTDATGAVVREWATQHGGFRLERVAHRGKGAAVRHGMLSAAGLHRFMCDADLAVPIEYIARFVGLAEEGWDVVIASRQTAGARRLDESALRYLLSRLFNRLIRLLFLDQFTDTQCGFKCFSATAADVLFGLQRATGWSFDVEILCLARDRNMRIAEVPVECHHQRTGALRSLSMGLTMAREIAAMKLRSVARANHDTVRPWKG